MPREIILKTKDRVKIAADYYTKNCDSVVIIAPGWCMTKNSKAFREISREFFKKYDVLTFDFRGHGKSGGFYTFSAKEENDLSAVVDFAKRKNYKKIFLAGFSLGAAVCAIYAAKHKTDKIILVSVPYDFSKIENQMYKKEAWFETFKKFELKRFLSIRPSVVIHRKTKPCDVIDKIGTPLLFIAGKKDPTVHFWHCEELFKKARCKKRFVLYENGLHAEDIFLHAGNDFMRTCFCWLEEEKTDT